MYQNLTLAEAESYIEGNLITTARAYVATGYFLKRIRNDRLYEEGGYKNFDEYVRAKYGKGKDWASRCIKVNDQLSVGGDSPYLGDGYQGYTTYQLVELAYMTEEQRDQASPDQTVRELREMRKPKEIPYIDIPGQSSFEADFPEIFPDFQETEPPGKLGPVVCMMDMEELLRIDETAEKVATSQLLEGPIAQEPEEDAAETQQNEPERCGNSSASGEGLSAYGTPKHVYPPGSLIATAGCEGGHDCSSCAMECGIRQEDRYCREAPMGSPFPCEHIVWGLQSLREEIGDRCQFVNHGLADHCAGSGEADPCCKECNEPCEYICARAMKELDGQQETGETVAAGQVPDVDAAGLEENVIDAEYTEVPEEEEYTVRYFLREQQEKLHEMLEVFKDEDPEKLPKKMIARQKIIVAALAAMVCDLENMELEKELEAQRSKQPELPAMRNNDQRKAFIDSYETWPVWIDTKETGERYYRYDLPDAAMVVKVYYHKCFDYSAKAERWEDRYRDGWGNPEYYLIQDNKHFKDCECNRSTLIDYLKEMQKKG